MDALALDDDDVDDVGVLDAGNLFLQLQKLQEKDNKCIHQNVLRNLYQ